MNSWNIKVKTVKGRIPVQYVQAMAIVTRSKTK